MSDFELWAPEPGDTDYVAPKKKTSKKVSACVGADFELWAPEPGEVLESDFDDIDPAFIPAMVGSGGRRGTF
jgi:hypothetical protein